MDAIYNSNNILSPLQYFKFCCHPHYTLSSEFVKHYMFEMFTKIHKNSQKF